MTTEKEFKEADEWLDYTFCVAFAEAKEIGLWGTERLAYVVNRTATAYKSTQNQRGDLK